MPLEPSSDLGELFREAQAGSAPAQEAVFERFRGPLLAAISRGLGQPLRRLFDPEDFLAEAFTEMFTRKFSDEVLRSPQSLWPYLRTIAENKLRDCKRKYLRSKRYSLRRDVPMNALESEDSSCVSQQEERFLEQLIEERLASFLDELPLACHGIAHLAFQGHTAAEIARMLGLSASTVYGVIRCLKKRTDESIRGGGGVTPA